MPAAPRSKKKYYTLAEANAVDLVGLSLEAMQAVEPRITADVLSVLTVEMGSPQRRRGDFVCAACQPKSPLQSSTTPFGASLV